MIAYLETTVECDTDCGTNTTHSCSTYPSGTSTEDQVLTHEEILAMFEENKDRLRKIAPWSPPSFTVVEVIPNESNTDRPLTKVKVENKLRFLMRRYRRHGGVGCQNFHAK